MQKQNKRRAIMALLATIGATTLLMNNSFATTESFDVTGTPFSCGYNILHEDTGFTVTLGSGQVTATDKWDSTGWWWNVNNCYSYGWQSGTVQIFDQNNNECDISISAQNHAYSTTCSTITFNSGYYYTFKETAYYAGG
ncbi:MAG: hypothetical protein KGH81_07825, partial [Thaumarchaeota archaeon]|nr:hypothetical protein [Nitrososphaerota archaeon]